MQVHGRLLKYPWILFMLSLGFHLMLSEGKESTGTQSSDTAVSGATKLVSLDATCSATSIHVNVVFEKAFDGVIYSKGAFYTPQCVYVLPGSGEKEYTFDIPINQCGTSEEKPSEDGKKGERSFENSIVMQNDAHFQDILDIVRKIRCTSASLYEKIVDFSPINVNMKDVVTASFTSDDVKVSIDVQNGRGPYAPSLNQGFIQIGDTVTLVVYMTAESGEWDIHVRECIALDSQERASLPLQDKFGCLITPKIMSPFALTHDRKNPRVQIAYSYIKAFRFPDDMQVQVKCVVAVCRDQCERVDKCGSKNLPASAGSSLSAGSSNRDNHTDSEDDDEEPVPSPSGYSVVTSTKGWGRQPRINSTLPALSSHMKRKVKRQVEAASGTLPVKRIFNVISPEDIANLRNSSTIFLDSTVPLNSVCVNQAMFILLLAFLLLIIAATSVALTLMCLRNRTLLTDNKKSCVNSFDPYVTY